MPEQATVPDNCQLVELTHASVMSNLRRRHIASEIYTFTGSILLAMNPYSKLPVYSHETMSGYPDKAMRRAKPHVFASAEEAYIALRKQRRSQSLVVSGESGAGKTETNKYLMRYLAWRSRKGGSEGGQVDLAEAILQSNPVLEAFGNARTGRNNNSSRFGKFVKIVIEPQSWSVAGAVMSTYLLEKSRVVTQAASERNYHSFYMLQAGATADERAALTLAGSSTGYACLRSSTHDNPGWGEDAVEHSKMVSALSRIGVGSETVSEALCLLAAVMHASNVGFSSSAGSEHAALTSPEAARTSSGLAGVKDISPLLLTRTVTVMSEDVTIQLLPAQAATAVAAFCKALYALLFEWLVHTINLSIRGTARDPSDPNHNSELFVGLLDVFGFESFPVNSFEQLCINFANERLHQFFLRYVFKMEAALYVEECISGVAIEYADNQPTLDLIDKPPLGLFRLLDSTCKTPKATKHMSLV